MHPIFVGYIYGNYMYISYRYTIFFSMGYGRIYTSISYMDLLNKMGILSKFSNPSRLASKASASFQQPRGCDSHIVDDDVHRHLLMMTHELQGFLPAGGFAQGRHDLGKQAFGGVRKRQKMWWKSNRNGNLRHYSFSLRCYQHTCVFN